MTLELAWAAGFFDGEGSVGAYASGRSFYEGKKRKYLKATISNTDLELLQRFQAAVEMGSIDGPYDLHKPNWSPKYVLRINGKKQVTALFEKLMPFLGRAKRLAFEEALRASTPMAEGPASKTG